VSEREREEREIEREGGRGGGGCLVCRRHTKKLIPPPSPPPFPTRYRIHNADVHARGACDVDDLVDVIEGSRVYVPAIYVINKVDQITLEELNVMAKLPHYCPVCAYLEWNLDGLVEMMWEYLGLTRVYTKPKGKLPDWDEPVVLAKANPTVEDFCNRIHRTLAKQFKHALVWGASVKHRPQRVGRDHVLADEDVVQIVKRV